MENHNQLMRCTSYCTAKSYNITNLVQRLSKQGFEPKYFDDAVHIRKDYHPTNQPIEIFYFSFGAVIIWGAEDAEERVLLKELQEFENGSLASHAFDLIYFKHDSKAKKNFIDEENNEVILKDNDMLVKLSMSHALAQSVKLDILEASVTALLERTDPLQKELARRGKVSLSKTEISKQIGLLFSERYSINLHSDILDTPEFFWRRPRYEPLYLMTAEFQDIQQRQTIMHNRLDQIHELYSILSNELNYLHSTRLEWIIVILIAIEVILGLQHFFNG